MRAIKAITIASNLGYAVAGIYAVMLGGPLAWLFLVACLALTLGSAWFHYNIGRGPERRKRAAIYDEIGMYLVLSTLLIVATGVPSYVVALIVWGLLIAATVLRGLDSYNTLGVLGLALTLELMARGRWEALAAVLGWFIVAFGARLMDEPLDNGYLHSFWHIVTAAIVLVLYGIFGGTI